MTRRHVLAFVVPLVLTLALAGGAWAVARDSGSNHWQEGMSGPAAGYAGMMGPGVSGYGAGRFGGGMMGDGSMRGRSYGIQGAGKVTTLAGARVAAQRYADTVNLTVGEVMEFKDNFYAELLTSSGDKATEVLVDPRSGAVRIEYGPARMWNTTYGMHAGRATPSVRVSPEEARQIANRWLAENRKGTTAGEADAFPGYYTLHTVKDDAVTGMLSVNALTGAVWYHGWHGDFVAMTE